MPRVNPPQELTGERLHAIRDFAGANKELAAELIRSLCVIAKSVHGFTTLELAQLAGVEVRFTNESSGELTVNEVSND